MSELERLARERGLLLQLLELGFRDDLESFLREALGLLIGVAGARRGCIQLGAGDEPLPSYRMTQSMQAEQLADSGFSQTVIDEVFATGEIVLTASAASDPRFCSSSSVKAQRLEAVLCVPMGGTPPLGIVYLQDRLQPGPFSADDLARTQLFARHVGRVADRLLWHRQRRTSADPTLPLRRTLQVAEIVGASSALAGALQQMATVAAMNVGVLFTGESGTGKTQFARSLHESSPRAARPFVELNCAALPESLFESEVFGSVPGAHSTATKRVVGKIEAAQGGTLFLDEIGELCLRAQAKLLQVLQSGQYYPLGASSPRQADVRVIGATNVDLAAAVKARTFREDLFYRLNVFPIRIPSLAERREDIPALAAHFVESTCRQNVLPPISISDGALMALQFRDWPGNIRELAHAVQAAVLRARSENCLEIARHHLAAQTEPAETSPAPVTFHEATRHFQASLLRQTLERERWNVAATARRLELTRAHVYNLLDAFQIERRTSVS